MSYKNPNHTHRFGNKVVRYDKVNNKCVIHTVLQDKDALFEDVTNSVEAEFVKNCASKIEDTEYFNQLDNT